MVQAPMEQEGHHGRDGDASHDIWFHGPKCGCSYCQKCNLCGSERKPKEMHYSCIACKKISCVKCTQLLRDDTPICQDCIGLAGLGRAGDMPSRSSKYMPLFIWMGSVLAMKAIKATQCLVDTGCTQPLIGVNKLKIFSRAMHEALKEREITSTTMES